mgnify:CR=1 FL=1
MVMKKTRHLIASAPIAIAAMAALHTSLGFAQKNFETEAERLQQQGQRDGEAVIDREIAHVGDRGAGPIERRCGTFKEGALLL